MKRHAAVLAVIGGLAVLTWAPGAEAHAKGLTLSRFGLIDVVSLQGNVDYTIFSDPNKVDFDKIGDRSEPGFNLTSFDLSLSRRDARSSDEVRLFLTFEPDRRRASKEAFRFLPQARRVHADPLGLPGDGGSVPGQVRAVQSDPRPRVVPGGSAVDPHVKFLGVDGVHLLGAEVTYQVPIPHYLQLALSVQSKGTEDGYPAATSTTPPTYALQRTQRRGGDSRGPRRFLDLTDTTAISRSASPGALGKNKPNSNDLTYLLGWGRHASLEVGRPELALHSVADRGIWAFRDNPIVTAGARKGQQCRQRRGRRILLGARLPILRDTGK